MDATGRPSNAVITSPARMPPTSALLPASTMLTTHPGQMVFRPIADFAMELDFTLGWVREISGPGVEAMLDALHAAIDRHQKEIAEGTADWSHLLGHSLVRIGEGKA